MESNGKGTYTRNVSTYHGRTLRQRLTSAQQRTLSEFTSISYSATHSRAYKQWLLKYAAKFAGYWSSWDRWLISLLIGVCTGLVAILMSQSYNFLSKLRWDTSQTYIQEGRMVEAWAWSFGLAAAYVIVGSGVIVFIHPPATGGGNAEIMAFLNGVLIHGVFGIKFIIVKTISIILSVASGYPSSAQGPIIALGAAIGSGIGQLQSKTFGIRPKILEHLRTPDARRTFTTAGVAAGLGAAYNAPLGGLMYAMEDLSSHWTRRISWLTFFCSVIATLTASVFNTAFSSYSFTGSFGYITLAAPQTIQMHIGALVPAVLLGVMGGVCGVIFSRGNLFFCKLRGKWVAKLKRPLLQKFGKILECVLIVAVMSTFTVFFPKIFPCQSVTADATTTNSPHLCYLGSNHTSSVVKLEGYTCKTNRTNPAAIVEYSGAASILQDVIGGSLNKLWARGVPHAYTWQTLLAIFPIWFFMTTYAPGSAIALGIFVPLLVTGALYGRLVGVAMVAIYESATGSVYPGGPEHAWLDPAIYAIMGAASILAGANRLAIASTVIVVEMSHDINTLILVMITVMVAKFVADYLCKPLHNSQFDGKGIPYLEQEPRVPVNGAIVNLELYRARDVMNRYPLTVHIQESVERLAALLKETSYSGFPVVTYSDVLQEDVLRGYITRMELETILASDDVYNANSSGKVLSPNIPYSEMSVDYNPKSKAAMERIGKYAEKPAYTDIMINLEMFMSLSVHRVDEDFSLHRAYVMFRSLGLTHLVVTDLTNRVTGLITRKDLINCSLEEHLKQLVEGAEEKTEKTPPNVNGSWHNVSKDPESNTDL